MTVCLCASVSLWMADIHCGRCASKHWEVSSSSQAGHKTAANNSPQLSFHGPQDGSARIQQGLRANHCNREAHCWGQQQRWTGWSAFLLLLLLLPLQPGKTGPNSGTYLPRYREMPMPSDRNDNVESSGFKHHAICWTYGEIDCPRVGPKPKRRVPHAIQRCKRVN